MSKPLSRAQALQNRAFLNLLRRTGNVRLACREVGLKYSTMQDRRRKHPGFAARWDAALVVAQARLAGAGREGHGSESHDRVGRARLASGSPPRRPVLNSSSTEAHLCCAKPPFRSVFRTRGGEPVVVRRKDGKLQVRRAQPGKLTPAAEQAFLAALSATCNVSLAAAAVGSCFKAFDRRRKADPAFAREMRMALAAGWERLEMALLESGLAGSREHDEWRHNDPPATPPMSVSQALQLMYLHQKAVLQLDEPDYLRRRRGESRAAHCARLAAMAEERERRARAAFEAAEVARWERGEPAWGPAGAAVRRERGLPDLAQVTGWSRADPGKAPHDGTRALFGGWRIEEMEGKLRGRHEVNS